MPVLKNISHEIFCQEVAKGATATAAYVTAGFKYSDGNASVLRNKPLINARIQELMIRGAARVEITVARIMDELGKLGFANMLDYVTIGPDGLPYCDLSRIDRDKGAAIQEVIVEVGTAVELNEKGDKRSVPVRKVRFKLADKRACLVDMGKHLGMFTERVEVTGKTPENPNQTAAELRAEILQDMIRAGYLKPDVMNFLTPEARAATGVAPRKEDMN
jgi:phage terminase small subunit